MTKDQVLERKVWFLRGLLVGLASSGQVVHYDEMRRLCRMNDTQLGTYLGEARKGLPSNEPDFCAVVVNDSGTSGPGWGNAKDWAEALRAAHRWWRDRRFMDNTAFETAHGELPLFPGVKEECDV